MKINISSLAKNAKLLPSKKLIPSRDFKIKKLDHDCQGYLDFRQENIGPSLTGTAIDYLTRSFLLHDPDAYRLAIAAVNLIGTDKQKQDLREDILAYEDLTNKADNIVDLSDDAFYLILKISAWEEAFRCGQYLPIEQRPSKQTIKQYTLMIERTSNFFKKYGQPIEIGYLSYTENGQVNGDGDYLLPKIIVDMKVSNRMMTADWVRQLLLYYVLLRSKKVTTDEIEKLMIFNPRYDQAAYVNVKDIDYNVLDFVLDQAEYVSKL